MKKTLFLVLIILLLSPLNSTRAVAKEEIVINEVMWKGSNEWIELKNLTNVDVKMEDWSIDNAKSGNKPLENIKGTIPANGYFLICEEDFQGDCDFQTSIISLKDECDEKGCNGDLVLKLDDKKTIIDTAPGNPWPAGKSKDVSMQREFKDGSPLGSWIEGDPPTPQGSGILLSADAGNNIISLTDKELIFDGSASTGNIDEYLWNFGDGNTAEGKIVAHEYILAGKYLVSLQVSSSKEKDEAVIEVTIFPGSIFISEFSLKDGWIEIVNDSENIQDISGWEISDNKEGDGFVFSQGSYIAPRSFLFLSSSLLNKVSFKGGSLFLLYPSKDVRQEIRYEKSDDYFIVAKSGENYFYTNILTPGLPNIISLDAKKEISQDYSVSGTSSGEEKSLPVSGQKEEKEVSNIEKQISLESEIKESKTPETHKRVLGENLLAAVKRNRKTLIFSAIGTSILSGFLGFGLVKLRRKMKSSKQLTAGDEQQKGEREIIEVEIEK